MRRPHSPRISPKSAATSAISIAFRTSADSSRMNSSEAADFFSLAAGSRRPLRRKIARGGPKIFHSPAALAAALLAPSSALAARGAGQGRELAAGSASALVPGLAAAKLALAVSGFSREVIGGVVTRAILEADVSKNGADHMSRHPAAPPILECGAEIRFYQEFLGHAVLDNTQVSTRISLRRIKEIHQPRHPVGEAEKARAK